MNSDDEKVLRHCVNHDETRENDMRLSDLEFIERRYVLEKSRSHNYEKVGEQKVIFC